MSSSPPEKEIRLVAFDLDNTLVRTSDADHVAYNSVLFFLLRAGVANLSQAKRVIHSVKSMLAECGHTNDFKAIQKLWDDYIETPVESSRRRWYSLDFCTHFLRAGQWYAALKAAIDWAEEDKGDQDGHSTDVSARKMALRCYEAFSYARLREIERRGMPNDIERMIHRLRKSGRTVVVITNGPSSIQWPKVHRCGIERLVDNVYVSGDLERQHFGRVRAKPDASIFEHVASCNNIRPSECVMIGDSIHADVLGALSAGFARSLYVTDDANALRTQDSMLKEEGSVSVTMRACMPEYVPEWLS